MNSDFVVTREEFNQGMQEQVDNIKDVMTAINVMRNVINTHAEIEGLHRFLLEKFIPKPLLEQATKEYYEQRKAVIELETYGTKRAN